MFKKKIEYSTVVGGVLLISVGLAFPYVADFQFAPVVGSLLAIVGGKLVLAIKPRKVDPDEAVIALLPQLSTLNRHLMDIGSDLSVTIDEFKQGNLDEAMIMDRVSGLNRRFYVVIHDLNIITGSTSDYAVLKSILQQARELSEIHNGAIGENNESGGHAKTSKEYSEKLAELQSQLESAMERFGETDSRKYEKVKVSCPSCQFKNEVRLGTRIADSGAGTCTACSSRFHVHRGKDGPYTKLWGTPKVLNKLHIKCPNEECKENISLTLKDGVESEERFCLSCLSNLEIDKSGDAVVLGEATRSLTKVSSGGSSTWHSLDCDSCDSTWRILYTDQEVYRAVCSNCRKVLEAPKSD